MTPTALLVTGSLGPGGTELAVAALARGLAARGRVVPRVVLLGRGGALGRALAGEGVAVDELGIDGPLRTPAAFRRLLRLARIVRRAAPAIVETFLFDADTYGMLAARLGRPRAVVTTRRAIKAHRPGHVAAYRWTDPLVHRIVANSEAVRRFTLQAERLAPSRVVTIPNGVDLARFAGGDGAAARARLGLAPDDLVVVSVGTIKPVKGQDVLLRALAPLFAGEPRLRWVAAGALAPGSGEAFAAEVARRGLGQRVLLPGAVDDVPGLLQAADLFVLPSRSEGMSNALLEAMAAARAIVATDVGGNAECLDGGAAGRLVPPGDDAALGRAIAALLPDPAARARLGALARARAAAEYSLDALLSRTEALYEALL